MLIFCFGRPVDKRIVKKDEGGKKEKRRGEKVRRFSKKNDDRKKEKSDSGITLKNEGDRCVSEKDSFFLPPTPHPLPESR